MDVTAPVRRLVAHRPSPLPLLPCCPTFHRWTALLLLLVGSYATQSAEVRVATAKAQWFSSPLIATKPTNVVENLALEQSMDAFEHRQVRDDFSSVVQFLQNYPDGAWAAAIETELAKEWHRTGWYSKALSTAESAWARRREGTVGSALWNHTGLRLAELYVSFGRPAELATLLTELESDKLSPGDRQRLSAARHALQLMQRRPEFSFRCGALALDRLLARTAPSQTGHQLLQGAKAGPQGLSLDEVLNLSKKVGLKLQAAFRSPGAPTLLPAVVHWRIGHFSAALERRSGLIHTQSPTLWSDVWISDRALDEESTGYCLVEEGPLPEGWRSVNPTEARTIFGRNGITLDNSDPNSTTPWDEQQCRPPQGRGAWPESASSPGMASASFHLMLLSQQIVDTPIGYEPPFGPPVYVTFQFTEKGYEHYGYRPQWTHNWQGSLYEDPRNAFESIWVAVEGGWVNFVSENAEGTVFQGKTRNLGRLYRSSSTNMTWTFPDGTKKLYSTPFGTNVATTRTFWLTGLEDAAGNRVSIGVNAAGRVESVADALGRKTQFLYELPDPGLPVKPSEIPVTSNFDYSNQVTRVIDPFGRSALLNYTKTERTIDGFCDGIRCPFFYYHYDLTQITDAGGLVSQFAYDPFGTVVTNLTTPYGSTHFQWGSSGDFGYRHFWVDTTDPEGQTERLEYRDNAPIASQERLGSLPQGMKANNSALEERNVFYWDKQAYATALSPLGYSNAVVYHFQYSENLEATGPVLESIKRPLESRIWMNYPGQGQPWAPGTDDQPNRTGRVLDDGSTQLWQTERDSWGNITREVDPVGRTLEYVWSTNLVDLLEIRENRSGTPQRLLSLTYDTRHLVTQMVDASRQTNRYTHNARGQILTITNHKGELTTFGYDANGYLITADGPLPGAQDLTTLTYDALGRVRTVTNPDGWVITNAYDNLDRPTKKSFPDGTSETFVYDRLDAVQFRDREGREYRSTYDSLQRLVKTEDPLGRARLFEWCRCGSLASMVDPMGRVTRWTYDIQGRVNTREYPDGSKVRYEYERTTSRLKRIRDEQDQITELSYWPDDRIQEKRFLNSVHPTAGVRFTYDDRFERMARMDDADGSTLYQYQPLPTSNLPQPGAGQLTSIDGPLAADTLSWEYDAIGRVRKQTVGSASILYGFDTPGRLIQLSNTLGNFSYSWEAGSWRVSSLGLPNGQQVSYRWLSGTNEARPQLTTWKGPDGTTQAEWGYEYLQSGLLSRWKRTQQGNSTTWSPDYDLARRLTQVSESSGGAGRLFKYTYDAADNRTSETSPLLQRSWQYSALNQPSGFQGPAFPDLTFEWDAEQRLYAIQNGSRRTEFGYDGLGRRTRVRSFVGGTLQRDHRYVWVGEEIAEERDGSGQNLLKRYFYGGFEVVKSETWPVGRYFYIRDHLHSIRAVTDAAGKVVSAFDYDPFGRRQQLAGTLLPDFGFGGHWQTDAEGLLLTLYRAYDPEQGRWISRDPLHETDHFNLYAYAANNPINWIDEFGLEADLTMAGVDRRLQSFGNSVSPPAGEIVVVIHGNELGSVVITGYEKAAKGKRRQPIKEQLDAAKLAKLIRDLPRFRDATHIRLISCFTANGAFPADLARYTGKPVLAPTNRVHGHSDKGTYDLEPPGEWKTFAPAGRGADIPLGPKASVNISIE